MPGVVVQTPYNYSKFGPKLIMEIEIDLLNKLTDGQLHILSDALKTSIVITFEDFFLLYHPIYDNLNQSLRDMLLYKYFNV